MKKKSLLILALIAASVFLLVANINPAFSASKEPVVIGFIGSFNSDAGKSTLSSATHSACGPATTDLSGFVFLFAHA